MLHQLLLSRPSSSCRQKQSHACRQTISLPESLMEAVLTSLLHLSVLGSAGTAHVGPRSTQRPGWHHCPAPHHRALVLPEGEGLILAL